MTGKEFKRRRLMLGLTQHEIAEYLGVSRNTVYNYEHDKVIPSSRLTFINNIFKKLEEEDEFINADFDKNQANDPVESFFMSVESENLLDAVLQRFHPLEIIQHVNKNLDRYIELEEFHMLAKNVTNQQEIEILKREVERLKLKMDDLDKGNFSDTFYY